MSQRVDFEQLQTIWPLQSFNFGDFAAVGECMLKLDRSCSEFGLLYKFDECVFHMAQFTENDEPVYFRAAWALAACYRPKCKKVCVQFADHQIDLEFDDIDDVQNFLLALKGHATKGLMLYEVPTNVAFMRDDFNMLKHPGRFRSQNIDSTTAEDKSNTFENLLWKTGAHSDFIVKARGKSFNVHKAIICTRSKFFENACKPGFQESECGYVELEEDASVIFVILADLYGVNNLATDSIFTKFALEQNMYKESAMTSLLETFIAADKYNLDGLQGCVASALIDRLPFIHDPLLLLDLAGFIHKHCPERDCGLRSSIVKHIQARLPEVLNDKAAREDLSHNSLLLMAVLDGFAASMTKAGDLTIDTSPESTSHTVAAYYPSKRMCRSDHSRS